MENKPQENNEVQVTVSKRWSRRRRVLSIFGRFLLFLLLLVLLPILLFQIPAVQNYGAQKLTHYLSNEWKTDVMVDKVYLGLFYEVNLEKLYVEDLKGDTLFYAGEFNVDHEGVLDIAFREFTISSIVLRDAVLQPKRVNGEENFQFLVDYFTPEQTNTGGEPPAPFRLNVRHLLMENVHFIREDDVKEENMNVQVAKIQAYFDRFNLLAKKIDLATLEIVAPDFYLDQFPREEEDVAEEEEPSAQLINQVVEVGDTNRLKITVADFDISEGKFHFRNYRKEAERRTPLEVLNFNYLDVFDIDINFRDFSVTEDLEFHGKVEGMSCRDTTGFVVENLSAEDATLTCEGLWLYDMNLRTPFTDLGDTLIFTYDSYYAWEEFVDEVKMDLRFNDDSHVALKDIITFAPKLRTNTFFSENRDEEVKIQGRIRGEVNRLDGRKLRIEMAKGLRMEGGFSTLNLAVKDEEFLHLELDRLRTTVRTLRKLIPGFNPPENFDRLGRLDFSGKFDGFFVDFVADGKLRTDIGSASMFMNMKLPSGRDQAKYSGDLSLTNFDLGEWSGNSDLGTITFNAQVKEGQGLTLDKASAKLSGHIDSLEYKGYDYADVNLNGDLEKNKFNGSLEINDENVNLAFNGGLDFTGEVPQFFFTTDIRQLSLLPLNISKRDLQFSGHVSTDLNGNRLSDVIGWMRVSDFQVVKKQTDTLSISNALLTSNISNEGKKEFQFQSNLGNLNINGFFDLEKIPNKFTEFVSFNYPGFADRIGLVLKDTIPDTMQFDYRVELFELQNLLSFFEEKLGGFDRSIVSGSYNGAEEEFSLEVEVPEWNYGNIVFDDVYLRTDLAADEGRVTLGVIKTRLGEKNELAPVQLIGTVYGDTLEFLVTSLSFFKILDNININGMLTLEEEDAWRVSFKESDLVLMNQTWDIDTDNYIRIGKGSVETKDFEMRSGDQLISLTNVRDEGLELRVKNVPLDTIDFIKNLKKIKLGGLADLHFKAKDIFRFEGLSALLRVDDMTVNGDNYGVLRLDADAPSVKESVNAFLTLDGDSTHFVVDGYYNPPNFQKPRFSKWRSKKSNFLDLNVSFDKVPTRIVNYFVSEVSNVVGSVSAENIHLFGHLNELNVDGMATASDISFKINPLQVTYRVPTGTVRLTNELVDASGSIVYDRFGNRAMLTNGLTHKHLLDWGLGLKITTLDNAGFLGLETTENDNPIFYGTALGKGSAYFSGTFRQSELTVIGQSTAGTHMFLPLTGEGATEQSRFINFTEDLRKSGKLDSVVSTELRGLNMYFDLDITDDAEMEVIFDKTWGDILRGRTEGNLKVNLTREGLMTMTGTLTAVQGDYLFTLMNLGLNKPFTVEPGGTVTWVSDPYEATLNVNAVYEGANASVANFIGEYLTAASDGAEELARASTPVRLKMNLTGQMLKPDINFDFEFPNLDGELKGYAENKLRTIRQDQNELNRQVFGLLVLGQFMPTGYTLQAGNVGINTLSEMLSNQLSIYLTELVSELLVGTNFIEGIDFNVSYNRFSSTSFTDADIYTGDEVNVRTKVRFTNRLSLSGGVEVGIGGGSVTSSNNQTTGNIQVEYDITPDRRLKVKGYVRTEPDIGGGTRQKAGAGLSFRKEFDSLDELMNWGEFQKEKKGKRKKKD